MTETQIQEPEIKVAETPEIVQATSQEASQPVAEQQESQEQINWRKFRQEREKERKEKLEAEKKAAEALKEKERKEAEIASLKAALEAVVKKPQYDDEEVEETQESLLDKKIAQALEKERIRSEEERRKQEMAQLPNQLAQSFKDFDQVVNQENIDYLQFKKPHLWAVFKNAPESFETWSSLYHTIKEVIPANRAENKARIEKNLSKPQSMSIPGLSATGDHAPQNLNDARKQANWERMQKVIRGMG